MANTKDQRDNAAAIGHQRLVATPSAVERHVAYCKVCKLPKEILSEVNLMIADGESNHAICQFLASIGYDNFTADNLLTHRSMFKYVCDEEAIALIVSKIASDEGLRQRYLSEYETSIAEMYEEVQKSKNKELIKLWGDTIPAIREQIAKVEENPLLPVKDYASAYDILLKDALLLEGKPTGRLYVEGHDDTSNGGNYLKGINKLCEIVGVQFDETKPKDDSESKA